MTELYIDEKPVAIPAGTSLTIKQQNPLITKNGTFSLDLALSLKERNNSILYKHIERLQSSATFKSRKALLISDNKIILNGSEAYISNTNEEVKIQLLSGNSELNYFIGTSGYISELNLGTEETLSSEYYNTILDKKYPEASFAPACVKINSEIINSYTLNKETNVYSFTNLAIQPFLISLLERTIKALGYSISYNQLLEDDFLCRIYILNNIKGTEYNKLMPGWTAKDFLEECEKFFNLIFDVDNVTKSVRIILSRSAMGSAQFDIDNVLDDYSKEVSKGNKLSYLNVKYDLPTSSYYKYTDIDPEILNKAIITTFATFNLMADYVKNGKSIVNKTQGLLYYNTLNLFYVTDTDTYYIVEKYNDDLYYLRPINSFRKYTTNSDDEYLSLKFIPAQMSFKLFTSPYEDWNVYESSMPYQSDKIDSETESEISSIKTLIDNGIPDANRSQRRISLAIYTGSLVGNTRYTRSQMDYVHEDIYGWPVESDMTRTLRLTGINGLATKYYKTNNRYDFTLEYTIKFISNVIPDVRADFLFQNKLFVCKELEYTITNDGINPVFTGTFLPIIS